MSEGSIVRPSVWERESLTIRNMLRHEDLLNDILRSSWKRKGKEEYLDLSIFSDDERFGIKDF